MQKDVILLLVGGVIGFVSSVGMYLIERLVDKSGKVKIYYKFIYSMNDNKPWGVREENQNRVLVLPVTFELQNTSNSTRVIRDVCVELYKGKVFCSKTIQIETIENVKTKGNKIESEVIYQLGAERGSYSFVLPPRSIQKQKVEYLLSVPNNRIEELSFDTIVIRYFDESDRKKSFVAKSELEGWTVKSQKADSEWIRLDKRFRNRKG